MAGRGTSSLGSIPGSRSVYIKILRGGKSGYDPRKLTAYLKRESAHAEFLCGNLFITDPTNSDEVCQAFERHHDLQTELKGGSGKRIKRPLVHIIARAAEQDGELSASKLEAISQRTMKLMGFDLATHPYHVQSHIDEEGTRNHVHIIASRISTDGKVWYGRREGELCWKVKSSIEKEFGLYRTQAKSDFDSKNRKTIHKTPAEKQFAKRGITTHKEIIAAAVQSSLEDSKGDWTRFCQKLENYCVKIEKIERASGKHGVVFRLEGVKITGSKLGRGFSYGKLQAALKRVKEGQCIQHERVVIKADPKNLESMILREPRVQHSRNMSRAQIEFGKSQIQDLRMLQKCRYTDLADHSHYILKSISHEKYSLIGYILTLLAIRGLVTEFQQREIHRRNLISAKSQARQQRGQSNSPPR